MQRHEGATLKRLREAKRWSLDEAADETGVDRGTLNRIELGKQRPHRATLRTILRALGASAAELVNQPRLLEALDDSASLSGASGNAGIEDRLGDLVAYVKTLRGKSRSDFIRAGIAVLTALEHARPREATGTSPDDEA